MLPNGTSGWPDGLTRQHMNDLLTKDRDGKLLKALTDVVNRLLAGKFDTEVNTIIFGRRLLAMSKKDVGVCPIAVGYTLR